MSEKNKESKYKVGKLFVSVTTPKDTIIKIENLARNKYGCRIGVSCYGNVLFARKYSDYLYIMNNTYMNLPDGIPLVWIGRLWGLNLKQTKGPFVFTKMIGTPSSGIKHFLIGDTNETLKKIKETYVNSLIVGTISPPFCDLEVYDYISYAKQIINSGADIVWISMTSPKQDYFAAKIQPYLPNLILIGVGAAFRYAIGEYKQTNGITRRLGLTGLVWRKWSLKLFYKYIYASLDLSKNIILTIIKRLVGKNYYE